MLPFWWNTIQNTITIAKMTSRATIRFHSGTSSIARLLGNGHDVFGELDGLRVARPASFARPGQVPIEDAEDDRPKRHADRGREERRSEPKFLPQNLGRRSAPGKRRR